jgi:predicted Zn-dependent protease
MKPHEMLQNAAALMQAGRIEEAENLCRGLLSAAPGQPDALHLLALAARDRGNAPEAERLFLDSLARAPRRPDVLVNFGVFLRGVGRADEAGARLREAARLAPDFFPAWHSLGLLLHATGELQEAAKCAAELTRIAPANPSAWELLAAVEQKQGNNAAAISACEQGLVHAPGSSRLHYSLAQLMREECRFEEAAAAYQSALKCGYETPDLYRNLTEAQLETGEVAQALASVSAGVARFPEHATLQRTRARLHFEAGAPGDPVAALAQTARAYPHNAELWETLGQLLNRLGRKEEVRAVAAEARAMGCPDTPGLLLIDALGFSDPGNPAETVAKFDRLVNTYPQHVESKLSFAQYLLSIGDPARAEVLSADVLEADPHDQLALAHLGTAWQMLQDPRADWLLDYERMVKPARIPPPAGYPDTAAFFREVQATLESLHRTQAHPIEQTLRGGTQTNGHLFRLRQPILRVLEELIRRTVSSTLSEFAEDPGHPFWGRRIARPSGDGIRFSGAWSVRLRSEGYHTSHIHPEGWISSALYVALPDEMGDGDEHAGHIQFGAPLGLALPPRRIVKPEVGTLVLFPSYMWHGTVPFTSQQPRITVAFDLVPQA